MNKELILVEDNALNVDNMLQKEQESFLQSTFGSIINNAVDIGLKAVLPDLIENEVIHIKNTIFEEGFKEGIDDAVKSAINIGKSAMGIVTGNFENANQVDIAVRKGGMIDTVSKVLDNTIEKAVSKDVIDKNVAKLVKKGKNKILDTVSSKIENTLETQIKNVEKLQNYSEKWKEAFESRDFSAMSKNYKNVEKYLKETIPLENTIKEARRIENLHTLIKNNGGNFDLTEDELKLAEKLIN